MEPIFDETQPIYLQIIQRICASILRGEYKPGDKLPGVIDAAAQFQVNHNTIQRVYNEMIRQGIAVTRRGEGTFVTGDESIIEQMHRSLRQTILEGFFNQMRQLGYADHEIMSAMQAFMRQRSTAR